MLDNPSSRNPENGPLPDQIPSLAELSSSWRSLAELSGEPEAWHELLEIWGTDRLVNLARSELDRLAATDIAFLSGLLTTLGNRSLLEDLVASLHRTQSLSAEALWYALEVLEGTGLVEEDPELLERRNELMEALECEDNTVDALVEHLDENPDEVWVALQGLAAVEPAIRAEIISDLGEIAPLGHGLAELLRILAHAEDATTRQATIDALARWQVDERTDPERSRVWRELAAFHGDQNVAAKAAQKLGAESFLPRSLAGRKPEKVYGLVTAVNGEGKGHLALVARDSQTGFWSAAVFATDVMLGVLDVFGQVGQQREQIEDVLDELRVDPSRDFIEPATELAVGLLGGSLLLGRPANPSFQFWIERVLGQGFSPRPFTGVSNLVPTDPQTIPYEEMPRRAAMVLDACPTWFDDSPLTYGLAEELLLRNRGQPPEPGRDAGAYRFLFEQRLRDRLEFYKRMLAWMGWFWKLAGNDELADSALAIAYQLGDPQHIVPAHPFTAELTTRSLLQAQRRLVDGAIHEQKTNPIT